MVEKRSFLQQDAVFAWFSELSSSQRVEFLCGLLDLCIPLELRFIGSCLEDLARKDYNSLRDSEIKANNPADLSSLTNVTDEVVRSKLLVSLALLTSNSRGAARVLYRTLTHIDSVINNYGLQLDGRTGEEFLLLFTMASNHPAFTFHQKQVLRQELTHLQSLLNKTSNTNSVNLTTCSMSVNAVSTKNNSTCCSPVVSCHGCHMVAHRMEAVNSGVNGNGLENALHTPAHSLEELSPKRLAEKHSRVVSVERVELKRVSKNEKAVECFLEVFWSDSSVSSVTKSLQELTEFLLKLSKVFPENSEKLIPHLTGANSSFLQERNIADLEMDLRSLASLPSHVLKSDHVKKFFSQPLKHLNPSTPCLHKSSVITAAAVRPICIQSSQSSGIQPALPAPSAQCPGSYPVNTSISFSCRARAEMASFPSTSISIPVSSCSQTMQNQEQTGILDWLRKLRLHKYYPVFQQLSMEKFLSLTEEDLDKFESLTTGAKKKLKTQLELEKEKSEKRCQNSLSQSSFTVCGIARVQPTSHVGPIQNSRHTSGLQVDVEHQAHQIPREYSSSSEYSSTPSSPLGLHTREESSDSAEENDRRAEIHKEFSEKEKPAVILNHYSASARPTAQVLPVQNDTASNCASHSSLSLQGAAASSSSIAPSRLLNSMQRSEKGNTGVKLPTGNCKFMHSSGSLEDKNKTSLTSVGCRSRIKEEKGKLTVDAMPPSHQPLSVFSGIHGSNIVPSSAVSKGGYASTLERVKTIAQPALVVESTSVTTVTSNSAFHMSPSPFKITVSSSMSNSSITGHLAYSSTTHATPMIHPRGTPYLASAKVALPAVSSMPMHSIPGTFCSNSSNNPSNCHPATSFTNPPSMHICPVPSSSPALSSVADNACYNSSTSAVTVQNQNHQPGCVVCSSCGCSGSCGSSHTPVNYATYLQGHFSVPSVLQIPLLPFPPLCSNGYINSSPAFPVVHPSYNNSLPSDSLLSGQSGFIMPQVQTFLGGTTGGYQVTGMMGNALGSSHKRNGNMSCYNCGAAGHRAQDCKMPPTDSSQQGCFRLRYSLQPESLETAD